MPHTPTTNPEPERLALSLLTAECNACLDRLSRLPTAALHARERSDLSEIRALLRQLAEGADERRGRLAVGERGPVGPAVLRDGRKE